MIDAKHWRWFGLAGHLIVGQWCRFHLCTVVGNRIVSTVGKYVPLSQTGGSEHGENSFLDKHPNGWPIGGGPDDFYETMVFKAGPPCQEKGCECEQPIPDDWHELECSRYKDAGSATRGHYEMCLRFAEKQENAEHEKEARQ